MTPRAQHRLIFLARVAALLYTILICVLSLIPGKGVPLDHVSDKWRHGVAYGVFALLLGGSFLRLRLWTVPLAFTLASLMGVAMELLQPSFGRSRDPYDALANSIGAATGCALLVLTILSARTGDAASRARSVA